MSLVTKSGLQRFFTGLKSKFAPISHTHKKSEIVDFPASLPADGGNAATVNGHTVNSDVPSGAKFTDTVYSHPTSSGNKHIPSGGSAGQFLKWSADGTAVWAADNNTTYNNATQSSAGLMSSTDKKKLDSVDMANTCMYDGTSTDISEMQSTCDYIDGGAY